MNNIKLESYDPYDIWSIKFLGELKLNYKNKISSKLFIYLIGIMELFFPIFLRKLLRLKKNNFPHVQAMLGIMNGASDDFDAISYYDKTHIDSNGGWGWGLPFKWYSKNGVYSEKTPYVTNTPYIMEHLLKLSLDEDKLKSEANMFYKTYLFVNSLKVMYENDNELCLSYAPVDEPLMVINANTYASFSFALHAIYGEESIRMEARAKSLKILCWVIKQQKGDGSWFYYAGYNEGNFIDCFHSCFVIKNLLKIKKLLKLNEPYLDNSINTGWEFIKKNFYDANKGLCKRFIERDIKDPFVWDLYDQAEYLGLLVDFGMYNEAELFVHQVEKKFKKNNIWYCRIDILGRRWGKQFLRWGIIPFLYQKNRLKLKEIN